MKITTAKNLAKCYNNEPVKVAGLVTLRQRPRTANGVTFISLEDDTGIINIICWKHIYLKFYKEIRFSKLLLITGSIQKECGTINVIANYICDMSTMLNILPKIN